MVSSKGKERNMVSESKKAANKRYDEKTYSRITVHFRKDEDAEVIKALADAKASGKPYREFILEWYNAYKETHE